MTPQRILALGRVSPADTGREGFVPQARLARVREQNILFSACQGAVYGINDTAADIWRALEEGMPVKAISDAIAASGVGGQEADGYVEAALHGWERLGLIRPPAPACPDAMEDYVSQVVAVADVRARILYPSAIAFPALTVFRHLEVETEASDVLFQLVEQGGRVHLLRDGVWAGCCSLSEVPVMIKGQLLAEALASSTYELALHAAALLNRGRALLLCGNPGAGKTTLSLALVRAGLGFMADDVTLLDPAGRCLGLAFAPAVKSGSWRIVTEYFPALARSPVYRRPDGRRVRFLLPDDSVAATPRRIGWVVLLRRTRGADPSLRAIEPAEILRGLLNGAVARDSDLSSTAFDVLCNVIRSAEGFRLTYSDLHDAVDLLKGACR